MTNWWDSAPTLQEHAAGMAPVAVVAPAGGGNWWDSSPIVGAPSKAPSPAQNPAAPEEASGVMGYVDNVVRQIANGATFGFADEIAAGLGSLTGIGGKQGEYDANLEAQRSQDKAFEAEYPIASTAAQLAGGIATGGAGMAKLGGTVLAKVPAVVRNVGGGAVAGATAGFGTGEGGLENRLSGAGTGGFVGGIVGAAAPPIINAASAMAAPVLNKFRSGLTLAQQKVAQALERDGMTPQQVQETLRQLGPEAFIADAAGDNTLSLARVAASTPGKAKTTASEALSARQEGQGSRILGKAEQTLDNTGNFYDNVDDLLARREAAAKPLYDRVMRPENLVPEEKFAPLASDPFLSKTIKGVKGDDLYGMADLPDSSLPVLDAVKKRLDDQIEAARRAGENNRARLLQERKSALVTATDEAFPEYAQARAAWEGPTRALDALNKGREFIKSDAEITAKEIAKLTDTDREFFKAGVVRQIRDILYNTPDGADAVKRLFGNKMKREKLEAAFPDKAAFFDFQRAMNSEAMFYKTNSAIQAGSRTAPMLMEAADATQSPLPSVLMKAATGNKLGALMDIVSQGGGRAPNKLPEKVANPLADLLFSNNQSQNLNALADLARRPAPLAVGQARRDGLTRGLAAEGGLLSGRQ
ncbi:hypothetical protein FW320_12580 [Azospirillum sp. Vi22]|uniref:hypothetical protein n=1 Tax=Azospirillum baldaniorum TaxID=1064539 RepID=UPI00157B680B|nr:hypothetical protein [Azospirillum baldaniorum]NUB07007.1 hypothetical protein [Azospirillum baldaniorum]